MRPKKNPKVDLEKRKTLFLEIGLVVAFAMVFISFEWSGKIRDVQHLTNLEDLAYEEELIPVTRQEPLQEEMKLPPSLKPLEVITIVDDTEEIDEELELVDVEADQETEIVIAQKDVEMDEEILDEAEIFVVVEEMPIFRPEICKTAKEGDLELYRYIHNQIKYPAIAQENGISGKVYVKFVVNRDGRISDAQIARGVDPYLDKEALRVINNLPRFAPGKQRGRPVKVSYTALINFVLQ